MSRAGAATRRAALLAAALAAASPAVAPGDAGAADVLPAVRRTRWDPGIPGGVPARTKVCATVPAPLGDGRADATGAIQGALDRCPAGEVVRLPPGTFRTTRALVLAKGVVLRGAGPERTRLVAEVEASPAIHVGSPGLRYDAAPVDVTADVPKGARELPVADASAFAVGDVVQVDQLDDPAYVRRGGLRWFVRGPDPRDDRRPVSPAGHRCQGQTAEVVGKRGGALVLATPLHLGLRRALRPQVYKPTGPTGHGGPTVSYAGIEDLYVTGGRAGMILLQNAAYSWLRNVESDGSPATGRGLVGRHVALEACYRCVVRDSHVHGASDVVHGGGAYGIALAAQSSECLVENNVVHDLNKPIVLQASGGGNVIAYNYVDDAWTRAAPALQETSIDGGHAAFPHMELFEGNWAPHLGAGAAWGNAGWLTFFRNHASAEQGRSAAAGERWDVAAVGLEAGLVGVNVIGNVLGAPGKGLLYEVTADPPGTGRGAVYRLGHRAGGGEGGGDAARYEDPRAPGSTASTLLRHGNFDWVTREVVWGPPAAPRALPASLYLARKPAFFGDRPWPWVDPVGARKLHALPAKERFDALAPRLSRTVGAARRGE